MHDGHRDRHPYPHPDRHPYPHPDHAVVIAGAGPTGLTLAAELAIAGIDALLIERRIDQHVDGSRAGGLLARTIEMFDQRGVAERFVDAGTTVPSHGYGTTMVAIDDLPTRHPYVLALWQREFEPLLAQWVLDDLGVPIARGAEVVGVEQDGGGVDVRIDGRGAVRAGYVVGCDGGRSAVRAAVGLDVAGLDASTSWLLAEVELDDPPPAGVRFDDVGLQAIGPIGEGRSRIVSTEPELRTAPPTEADLRAALERVYGIDVGLRRVVWLSWFTDVARQAASYRAGRVLLAGDAAHVHPPHGGQGLNTGVQDAMNLGWKLARVVRGSSPDSLLDTYHAERHPVGAWALTASASQVALNGGGPRHQALRDQVAELLAMDEPRRRLGARLSGLDIRYDAGPRSDGEPHPLIGRRMPDLDLAVGDRSTRVAELLRPARPLLLVVRPADGATGRPAGAPAGVVHGVDGALDGATDGSVDTVVAAGPESCELPVIGRVSLPAATLIRPDGYVAWAGSIDDPALARAATFWFGHRPVEGCPVEV